MAKNQNVDLFLFMGQSNMAGRGICSNKWTQTAPELLSGAGYEYRAVSCPNGLHPIVEPFGKDENKEHGIDDGDKKTGSLVTAFTNAYYHYTGMPIVGISASKGGSSIKEWQPGSQFLEDAKVRLGDGRQYLKNNGYNIRNIYMLWCQGETDGKNGMEPDEYNILFENMLNEMLNEGVNKCFLIRIGEYNMDDEINFDQIIKVQTDIARENPNVVMVSTDYTSMKKRDGMWDEYHYYQWAYNEVGTIAGMNTAFYVNHGKEPTMYDPYYNNLYFSKGS